jgi:hypothetical protein
LSVQESYEKHPNRIASYTWGYKAYQNAMRNSDRQNAHIECDRTLDRVMLALMADFTELFKQYSDNPAFKCWLSERNFSETYRTVGVGRRAKHQTTGALRCPRTGRGYATYTR